MSELDHLIVTDLLDQVRHSFYGKYRGTVTSVDDATLRIKAKVDAVLVGWESGWCMPCVPYAGKNVGMAFLPEPGAGVWIEFERGDTSCPIWVGCYWREGEIPSDATGTIKAVVTAGGSKILLDDDARTIILTDSANNKVTLSSDGITLERGLSKVVVSTSSVSVNDGALEVT
jgi:uncharacterized protein involved in type VI secretion and phage assembly